MSNLGYLMFDLDGTLIDSMQIDSVVFAEILAEMGVNKDASRAHYLATSGEPLKEQFLGMLKEKDPNWQGDLDEFEEGGQVAFPRRGDEEEDELGEMHASGQYSSMAPKMWPNS